MGDVVDVWVYRRTGVIDNIVAPDAPDFWHLLGVLLISLGLVTYFLSFCTIAVAQSVRSAPAA